MSGKTKILIVEHDKNDIELLHYELKKGGINYEWELVQNECDYRKALKNFAPDVILSDYTLPGFDGATAFKLREKMAPDTPFIFVTGAMREENAVEFIKSGITEYALKDKLYSLIPKIQRALNDVKEKQQKGKVKVELAQSERQLARAQQIAQMGSWETDFDNNVTLWSDETCRIYGVTPEENYQSLNSFLLFVHPDDLCFVKKTVKDSLYNFRDYAIDHRIIRKDGVVRHLHSESRFEFDTAGKPINLFGITQDVTHVKKIEAELHKSELNIHTIFETTNVGFILTDTSFKIVTSNSVINTWAKDLMGFDLVTGGSLRDILPPKRFGEFENMMGLILQGEQVSYEMEYPVANGAAKWFHMNGKQVKEINGKASGICLAVNDVTERKKAEKAITDSETRLKKAEQISHMGNWELNFADSMLSLSDEGARIFGFPPEQNHLSYQKWTELVPPEDLESVLCLIKESKVALKDTNFHHRIVLKDGTVKHILSESKFKMDETGKPTGLYGITQDVTERKEAERKIKELNENLELRIQERTTELTKANAALEAFSYSVSHDLRAPVRTIMSFSNLIQKNFSDTMEPGAKELFTFIDDGSKRMNDIIDNLLKFAKYGKDKLNLVPLNMTKTVQGVWLNLCRNAPNNAVLEVEELQVAHVDRLMMEQVIVNLLSNAVKYSSKKAKPVIKVWCEQADENVTFYFRDNGAGFDMKNYERLFGAFQRLHNNTEFAGNGVGLMLVKSILEKHGGTVGAEGKVNEGATFYFTLPRFSE